jgi:hypothetical protein
MWLPHIAMRAQSVVLATMLIAAIGCSSSSNSKNDGGGGSGGGSGSTGTGGATGGGGGATNANCQTIRLCAVDCADDACLNACKSMAPAAADAYQALADCTTDPARGGCPSGSQVSQCLCMAQYLQDPPCADLLNACIGNISDTIADLCH